MASWKQLSIADTPVRNVYPGVRGGATLGQRSTAATPYSIDPRQQVASGISPDAPVNGNGALGRPLGWWAVLVIMLVALMFIARRLGGAEDFKSIRLSVYNVIVISLAAIIGITFFKVLFNRFRVPGLTEIVTAV
jgi:hypothetical protein